MNRSHLVTAAVVLAYAILPLSCGSPGGVAGVETTNGPCTVALLPDGKPAARARVRIIDCDGWLIAVSNGRSPVLDSLQTDAAGVFAFLTRFPSRINVEIEDDSSGLLLRGYVPPAGATTRDTVRLVATRAIRGVVTARSATPTMVFIAGSHFSSPTNGGHYLLSRIPVGDIDLMALLSSGSQSAVVQAKSLDLQPSPAAAVESLLVSFDTIRVDDLSLTAPSIRAITGAGNWYPLSDADIGGASSSNQTIVDDSLGTGRVLRIQCSIAQSTTMYAGAGVFFAMGSDGKPRYFNLSKMRSLRFRARGDGTFRASLHTFVVDSLGSSGTQFGPTFQLGSQWTEYEIFADSLQSVPFGPGTISWAQAASRVDQITFIKEGAVVNLGSHDVFIDDIEITGMNGADMF